MAMYAALLLIITLVTITGILFINAKKGQRIEYLLLGMFVDLEIIWLLYELDKIGVTL